MQRIENVMTSYWDSFSLRLPDFIEGAITLILFVLLAGLLKRLVGKRLEKRTDDKLRARFIARVVSASIIMLGLMLAMNAAGYGDVAAGLMAGAGVSAFVVGFALKDIGENFLAGFLLSFSRPFRVDDTIEIDGFKGKVKALNLRNTHIKTFDGKDIFIPNATLIKNPLVNYTLDGYLRQEFVIGVDYATNFEEARKVITAVLKTNKAIALENGPSVITHHSLGASSYNIKVQYWQDMFDSPVPGHMLKTTLIEHSLKALTEANIETPGDIIEVRPMPKVIGIKE